MPKEKILRYQRALKKLATATRSVEKHVAAWHKARHEVENAWKAIPREDRTGLQPPDDLLSRKV